MCINRCRALLAAFILMIVCSIPVLAYTPTIPEIAYRQQQPITDDQLKQLAINKGIIPANADEAYYSSEKEKKNTLPLWILTSRADKVKVIEQVIGMFKQRDGALISRSADYYVNEINGVMYNSIVKGDIEHSNRRGVGVMLKTIAIMDGDYNDGTDKVTLARKQMGSEIFEAFKNKYPDKYQYLLKSQENIGQGAKER